MNLFIRIVSALIGVVILGLVSWLAGSSGMAALCGLVILVAINEFRRTAFPKVGSPLSFQWVFFMACALSFFALLFDNPLFAILGLVSSLSLFLALGLWTTKENFSNDQILQSYGLGLIGIVYCAVFPALVLKTLFVENGLIWFYSLAVIVFSGDTLAYFGGRLFGKRKIYPQISPKKTVEGCISGALGSTFLGAGYFYWLLPGIPLYVTLPFCLVCGLVAQSGDLFVSLIKRIADVKDTGRIMPGHGGVLDRLDGICIAAPLVYTFSVLCLYFFDL